MANALRQGAYTFNVCSKGTAEREVFGEPQLDFACSLLQFDPEGFGEIPLEDFLTALRSPEWKAEIPANKRDILLTRAKESRVEAVTFQDFVNVVSL